MGLPLWLVTGCAALVGLAVGAWLAGIDRERLRQSAAAKVKAAEERAQALEEKERAFAQKIQEVEEKEQKLNEGLRDVEQQQAVLEKLARSPVKGKASRARKGKPEKTSPESV